MIVGSGPPTGVLVADRTARCRSDTKVRGMGFEPRSQTSCSLLRIPPWRPNCSLRSQKRYAGDGIRTGAGRARSSLAARDRQGSESHRGITILAVARIRKCGGWDSNPRTPTGADLKSAAFGLAQPPPRGSPFRGRTVSGFVLPDGQPRGQKNSETAADPSAASSASRSFSRAFHAGRSPGGSTPFWKSCFPPPAVP